MSRPRGFAPLPDDVSEITYELAGASREDLEALSGLLAAVEANPARADLLAEIERIAGSANPAKVTAALGWLTTRGWRVQRPRR